MVAAGIQLKLRTTICASCILPAVSCIATQRLYPSTWKETAASPQLQVIACLTCIEPKSFLVLVPPLPPLPPTYPFTPRVGAGKSLNADEAAAGGAALAALALDPGLKVWH